MRLAFALVLVACSGKAKPTSAPAPGSAAPPPVASPYPTAPVGPATTPLANVPGVKVTLADVGLEQSALDRTVDPCVDFYQFACGGWLANNPVPPEHARWGRAQELEDKNRAALQALLEEAAKGIGADASTKQLGDFYAACMDEAAAERRGLAPAKSLLGKLRIKDAKGFGGALAELHASGIWAVWRAETVPAANGTYALHLDAAPLPLARDAYLDPKARPQLDAYKQHVGKLLAIAGVAKADAAAADVVAIETELARLATGDATALDAKALAKQTRAIDWKAYWKRLGVAPAQTVIAPAKLVPGLDRIKARFKPAQWASYFTFRATERLALGLGKAATDAQLELARLALGVEKGPDRARHCIAATADALGDLLGQAYARKYHPGTAKTAATALGDALARALADELARAAWLTDATRPAALAKLTKVVRLVGFPEHWKAYDAEIARDDLVGNLLRTGTAETHRRLARWGKPVDRAAWDVDVFATEASYDARTGAATLPAGVLQPPFFGPDRTVAANLGGLGFVYARTLVKAFDDDVKQLDTRCVEVQYAGFEALPKGFVNGKLTLVENLADAGGIRIAFKAYRALRKDAAKVYVADGYTEDQQFFIAAAQALCTRDRPAELAQRLAADPFAPPKFRVYGSMRNMKEFSEAFSCAPGTPMSPAKSCSVW